MLRKDLVNMIADKLYVSPAVVQEFVDAYESSIIETLEGGEDILLSGFLGFKVKINKGRKRYSMKLREEVYSPPSYKLVVTPSVNLKNKIRQQKVSDYETKKYGIQSREDGEVDGEG